MDHRQPGFVFVKKKSQWGFTLVELIITIGVLAIVAVLGLAALDPVAQIRKGRDTRRKSDLAQIKRAALLYHNDNGNYPPDGDIPLSPNQWDDGAVPPMIYMRIVPGDPSGGDYVYDQTGTQDYCLSATLENIQDEDIAESQARCSSCPGMDPLDDYVVCPD